MKYRDFYKKVRPFTRRDYVKEAKQLYIERTIDLTENNRGMGYSLEGVQFDAEYVAKWSALTRKRNAGLLLSYLYKVTTEQELDITPTLAKRFLIGCVGRGLSIQVLIKAFATSGRQADKKSEEWERLDELIEYYKDAMNVKFTDEIEKRNNLKKLAWSYAKEHLKHNGTASSGL